MSSTAVDANVVAQDRTPGVRGTVDEIGVQPLPRGAVRWAWLARFGPGPLLVALDLFAVVVGVLGAELVEAVGGFDAPARKTAAFGLVFLLLLAGAGLYRSRLSLSVLDDLPTMTGRWLAAAALTLIGQVAWSDLIWRDSIINWSFVYGALGIWVVSALFRACGYSLVRRLRSKRHVSHRTLILGAGTVGNQVAEILTCHTEYGLHPIGFLDADPHMIDATPGVPVLGGPESLMAVLEEQKVRNVVVAFSSMKESQMVSLIRTCDRYRVELFVVPRLFELQQVHGDMDNAWGMPLVRLRRSTYRTRRWEVKRAFDVVVAGSLLLLTSPALLAIALAVRLDSGPGVLFRQERVGVDGRTFEVLKFRSLRPANETESATNWNVKHDSRLTPLGRFLRKSSLDELPQLLNVLRGDMSIVGPRPERPHFVHQFRGAYPSYEARHRVPSGLTGWAQVHGLRGDTSIAERARFDNYYIENWSLWLDVKIILRTVTAVVRGAGG